MAGERRELVLHVELLPEHEEEEPEVGGKSGAWTPVARRHQNPEELAGSDSNTAEAL